MRLLATAWLSLFVWIAAATYCSSLCFLGCGPTENAQVVYTHEGCEGHPADSSNSDCKDLFCDSVGNAYAPFDQFTFLKTIFPVVPDSMLPNLQESPADTLQPRQSYWQTSAPPPVVSLDTANQSHAPPRFS